MPAARRPPPNSWYRPPPAGRWALAILLVVTLFWLGVYDETVFAGLMGFWQKLLAAAHLDALARHWQQGISGQVTRRPLPVVATYAAGYLGLCLLLLRVLLPGRAQWRLALALYGGVLLAYVLVAGAGKLAGDVAWAYRFSRHLIDFLVSPVPVAALLVLFRAGFGPAAQPR